MGPPAFAPFFDFAFEELMGRIQPFSLGELRRVARLLGQVHLEQPDIVPGIARVLTSATSPHLRERSEGDAHINELALGASAFAGVYSRLAALQIEATEQRIAALQDVAEVLGLYSGACEEVLSSAASSDTP